MDAQKREACPECATETSVSNRLDRRTFIRATSSGVAGIAGVASVLGASKLTAAPVEAERRPKPAESLVRELYESLSDEQKKSLVQPYNHTTGPAGSKPTRLQTFNSPVLAKRIADSYTKPQQDLVKQTLKAILSGEEAYDRLTRHGKWDGAGSFEGNGAVIFGDPSGDKPFSWVFSGHHLTVRCDGNSQPNTAFGGPLYYGHSATGYSETNVYNYQTKKVLSVFDALNEKQRQQAVVVDNPGDGLAGLNPRADKPRGIAYADLDESQRGLVADVMRLLLAPFRQEDGDEVMQLIKANGGLEKVQLGFYKDAGADENKRWHYWRLEGPGFIWNYRVLPHVHCFVNVVSA